MGRIIECEPRPSNRLGLLLVRKAVIVKLGMIFNLS